MSAVCFAKFGDALCGEESGGGGLLVAAFFAVEFGGFEEDVGGFLGDGYVVIDGGEGEGGACSGLRGRNGVGILLDNSWVNKIWINTKMPSVLRL